MNKTAKKMLMPVFRALAKPGLTNPHSPNEVELMIAGVKPVAIVGLDDFKIPELNLAITNGQISVIATKHFDRNYNLYYHRDCEDIANRAMSIYRTSWDGITFNESITEDDKLFISKFQNRPNKFEYKYPKLMIANSFINPNSSLGKVLRKTAPCLSPIPSVLDDFNSAVFKLEERSQIKHLEFTITDAVTVIAQSSKIQNGRELYDRYFDRVNKGYNDENVLERIQRIGELLGFSKNDVGWFVNGKYNCSYAHYFLMKSTEDIRRYARKHCMLNGELFL